MNSKMYRNRFFAFGMIVFLMLFISACSDMEDDGHTTFIITSLNEITTINTGDAAVVVCRGNYVYTVGWSGEDNNFNIIDMSNPAAPVIMGSYSVGSGYGLALNGDYAYIETDGSGDDIFDFDTLGVMDISDPTNPTPVMENDAGYSSAYQTYYHDGYVYNASYNIIGIYSVDDPADLVHETNVLTDGIEWLALSGNYMYGIDDGVLRIWDITDPTDPAEIGVGTPNPDLDTGGIAIKGNYVFAMGTNSNVLVFDVSDKANPDLVVNLTLTSGTAGEDLYEARILRDYLLIAGENDFYVVDITDPTAPREIDSVPLSSTYGWGFDVLNERYAIVADDTLYRVIQLW